VLFPPLFRPFHRVRRAWIEPMTTSRIERESMRIRFVSSMGVGERKKRIGFPNSFRSNPNPIQRKGRNE
jgi:hypothetical protein